MCALRKLARRPEVSKGKRVICKQTGQAGTVTKVIGRCLFVAMDDGTEWSGGRLHWKLEPKAKAAAK